MNAIVLNDESNQMVIAANPVNEELRLRALHEYDIMDSEAEECFNDIVELAARICETPVSLITLLDEQRQWFKARHGVTEKQTPRNLSFCAHTILQNDVMVVSDASADLRFFDNPLVNGDFGLRFYAGMPLRTAGGFNLGTLCVMDYQPRKLSNSQLDSLRKLSRQVITSLELRLKVKLLNRSNDHNQRMLSIVAHDIRSPLNELHSLLTLRGRRYIDNEEFERFSHRVRQSLEGTGVLLKNLLDWAVADVNGTQTVLPVSLPEVIGEVVKSNSAAIESKGNRIEVNKVDDLHITIDERLLHFLLRNLIVNANKFTSSGRIVVSYRLIGGSHELSVADTGIGMSEEKIHNLFNWEKRINSPGTSGEKGSGIGLRLCSELLKRVGGTLEVVSERNVGTVVTLKVPVITDILPSPSLSNDKILL